jgi:hypothetical protein
MLLMLLVLVEGHGLVVDVGCGSSGVLGDVRGGVLSGLDLLFELLLGDEVGGGKLVVLNVGDALDASVLGALLEGGVLWAYSSGIHEHVHHLLLDGLRTVVALGHQGGLGVVVLLPDLCEGAEWLGLVLLFKGGWAVWRSSWPVVVEVEVSLAAVNVDLRAFNVAANEHAHFSLSVERGDLVAIAEHAVARSTGGLDSA